MRAIRNYTSTQDVGRSIELIESRLISFGAKGIYKEYEGREVQAVSFTILEPKSGQSLAIRLPANVGKVNGKLLEARKGKYTTARQKEAVGLQARRTAWKLMLDWIDVQLSLVAMDQAEIVQVFLPYVVVRGQSVYERMTAQEGGLLALTDQREEEGT